MTKTRRKQHRPNFSTPGDLPLNELMRRAELAIERGFDVHIKVSCGRCGIRLTAEQPNAVYESFTCFACGWETKFRRGGFLLKKLNPSREDMLWVAGDDAKWAVRAAAA